MSLSNLLWLVWCLVRALLRSLVLIGAFWRWLPRRPSEPGFKYVYVNQDGSAREVSPAEQQEFAGYFDYADAPPIKFTWESLDPWGSRSGFLPRRLLPKRIRVEPVHPNFDAVVAALGNTWQPSPYPEPGVSHRELWARACRWHLEAERRREAMAKYDSSPGQS